MKQTNNCTLKIGKEKLFLVIIFITAFLFIFNGIKAQSVTALRRPVSPNQPMWLVHIDTWNYPDPQKIIDLIPTDIRPYVVMDISLSINHDATTGRFKVAEYGYETAKSWMKVCGQNHMWSMIQVASGGMTQFPDSTSALFEEFFRNYPNFIGFNYAEQFWGFDDATDPVSTPWSERISHFADLLALSHQYGGYLVVSWCGNQYAANINPIGMLKRNSAFAQACSQYSQNFILCEKYTTKAYKNDMESVCLGAYLSGFSGQYGIRYDNSGWTDSSGANENFSLATGVASHLEHIMLTGETVIDGPEIIWTNCFKENSPVSVSDGYTARSWGTYSHFNNIMIDIFRKILDGTVRIPTRQEVINRTKVVIINNVSSGSNDEIYSSPESLFEGLYRMDGDGNYQNNFSFFKKTGRYPTIPTVYQLKDAVGNSFQQKINKSEYATHWPTISSKVTAMNSLFPEEYHGDIYAGRLENGWVIYNPYKTSKVASGTIGLKYNTCDSLGLSLSHFTGGVIKETSSQIKIYLNNYDDQINLGMRTDVIKIYGGASQPTYSYTDRENHIASVLNGSWSSGVYTLTVSHNGPLDITLNCSGNATGRLINYTQATLTAPDPPSNYAGDRQYEAEIFDYKNINGITTNGYSGSLRNYTGQGYTNFGTNSSAALRQTVNVLQTGTYKLKTRYWVTGGNVSSIDLYVNGSKVATPQFSPTGNDTTWAVDERSISLNAGNNTVEFRANSVASYNVFFDNIVVATNPIIEENNLGFCSVDGVVNNDHSGYSGSGFADTYPGSGNGINWKVNFGTVGLRRLIFRYAATNNRAANILINGVNVLPNITFPSTGSWSTWDTIGFNVNIISGVSSVRLEGTGSDGLPNIDYLQLMTGDNGVDCSTPIAYVIQENQAGFCGVDGTVDNSYSGFTNSGYANTSYGNNNGINWSVRFPESGSKSFTFRYAATDTRTAKLIINGNTSLSVITFPSTGSWNNWQTVTVNANIGDTGISAVRLESTVDPGLPNIDYIQVVGGLSGSCGGASASSSTVLKFNAARASSTARLNWTLPLAKNDKGFEVQRSDDGIHWQALHFVSVNVSVSDGGAIQDYIYTDLAPLNGRNFYRLRQEKLNGEDSFSAIKAVDFGSKDDTRFATVSPNPTYGMLNLKMGSYWKTGDRLAVFNSAGSLMFTSFIKANVETINTASFSPGVYFIKISNKEGQSKMAKFIKL